MRQGRVGTGQAGYTKGQRVRSTRAYLPFQGHGEFTLRLPRPDAPDDGSESLIRNRAGGLDALDFGRLLNDTVSLDSANRLHQFHFWSRRLQLLPELMAHQGCFNRQAPGAQTLNQIRPD